MNIWAVGGWYGRGSTSTHSTHRRQGQEQPIVFVVSFFYIFVTVVVAVVVLPLITVFLSSQRVQNISGPRLAWILYQSDEKLQLFTLRKTRSEMEEAEAPGHLNSLLKHSGNIAVLVPILEIT